MKLLTYSCFKKVNRLAFSFETVFIKNFIQIYQPVTAIIASGVVPIISHSHPVL